VIEGGKKAYSRLLGRNIGYAVFEEGGWLPLPGDRPCYGKTSRGARI
jgi:hypothetical protein